MPISPQNPVPAMSPPFQLVEYQTDFIGGMNLLPDETKIGVNQYREAYNVLNRFNNLDPVFDSIEIGQTITESLLSVINSSIQGGINAGQYIVIFAGGKAWYRLYNGTMWSQVPGFQMSTTAKNIYSCAVPTSYNNLERQLLVQVDSAGNPINYNAQTLFTDVLMTSSPACLVCQDGINQPYIIYIDPESGRPASRATQTYAQWAIESPGTTNIREYVPVGLQMLYYGGILYIVNAEYTDASGNMVGAGSTLFRSVEGRALDFVVNITASGDKGGDATTTSYSPGFGIITALYTSSGYPNGFIASTGNSSIGIIPDTTNTIFGEPTFDRDPLFGTGPLNPYSTIDILGDTAFIDGEGVKSFNGAKQVKIDSNNNIFSLNISKLFEQSQQNESNPTAVNYLVQSGDMVAAGTFNGYALFSVTTIYGNLIVVYDTYNQCWVSMIQFSGNFVIKQFISLMPYVKKIYGITTDNRIFDLFASNVYLPASVTTAGFTYVDLSYEQKPTYFRCAIKNSLLAGIATIQPIYDLIPANKVMNKPINNNKKLNNIVYPFINPQICWECGYNISWTGGGSLVAFMHKGEIVGLDQSINQSTSAK